MPARDEPPLDPPDSAVVADVLRGATDRFAIIVQRYNQRLYRVARGVLGDDPESEDALQQTWLQALSGLDRFRGEASLATWLTAIVLREARARRRRRPLVLQFDASTPSNDPSPLERTTAAELQHLLERMIDALPPPQRMVFVLRELEQMSVAETAAALGISSALVKVRTFRARRRLQARLRSCPDVAERLRTAYGFAGTRCARMWIRVREHAYARADAWSAGPAPR